jgi:hypothetical protein
MGISMDGGRVGAWYMCITYMQQLILHGTATHHAANEIKSDVDSWNILLYNLHITS